MKQLVIIVAIVWPPSAWADILDSQLINLRFHADAIGAADACQIRPEEWAEAAIGKVFDQADADVRAAGLQKGDPRLGKFYTQDVLQRSYMQGAYPPLATCPIWLTPALLRTLDQSIGWQGN